MKMNLHFVSSLVIAVGIAAGSSAHAAVITWQTPATISGDTNVSTTGTLERAYNMTNQSGSATTINGVNFAVFGVTSNTVSSLTVGSTTITSSSGSLFSGLGNGSASTPFSSLSTSYQTLLGQFVRTGGNMTLTLNSLTVGYTYQLEIWTNRSNTANAQGFTATAGNSVVLDSNTTDAIGGVGQFVLGSFTADATSQAITFTPNGAGLVDFSAFQLRTTAVPEPSAIALLIAGGVGLLLARRRSMRNRA